MASDVMRVRLHLRQIRVLAVALDTPSELRVEVESTVRRPRCPACGCTTPAGARCAIWRCRGDARRWCGCGAGSCATTARRAISRTIPSSRTS